VGRTPFDSNSRDSTAADFELGRALIDSAAAAAAVARTDDKEK
jgi:hypothetical protein